MIRKILVANRGEIACRVFRSCAKLGIATVAVYSTADAHARHVAVADAAACIGPPPANASYLQGDKIIAVAKRLGADAIHPGYGLLSENAAFARAVVEAGLIWIGPPPHAIEIMGDKVAARQAVAAAGVPCVPGSGGTVASVADACSAAEDIGYPVMLKAAGGGGGIGMYVAHDAAELERAFATGSKQAQKFFGNASVYLEKYIASARHVEVQLLGLADGTMVAVGDRDCSAQRRHQKVVEEAPAPGLSDGERDKLHQLACRIAAAVDYRGAGTIETIFDRDSRHVYFLEMNTRLQVEHAITEMVSGVDLVAAQIAIADGRDPGLPQPIKAEGHAFELRVCAEDPVRFLPSPGAISAWREPVGDGVRVDAGYRQGDTVTPYYDSLMAKLCVWAPTRLAALDKLARAATEFHIEGLKTTLAVASRLAADARFRANTHDTSILAKLSSAATT
ncbi:MAG TPA: biotin carboxylase N-terminal domain-containing protein [Nevskiaceae bacterium]|nr:biotin carboxylase N-terminal domain-containing protein [Nevskiaceae bacterium]